MVNQNIHFETYKKVKRNWGRGFILPGYLFLVIFMMLPIISVIILSFTSWDGINEIHFTGLSNYFAIFTDYDFWRIIWNNITFMIWGTPIWTLVPLLVAVLLYEEIRGHNFFRTVFLLPTVLSASIVGTIFKFFMSYEGPLNTFLRLIHLDFLALNWFNSGATAIPLIVLIINWAGFGSSALVYLAGMSSIDSSVYESALLDGAGWWRRLFQLTIPMISNVVMFVLIMNVIASFSALFGYVYVMTNGGPGYETTVIEYLIYLKAFRSNQFGYASALSLILLCIVILISLILLRVNRKHDRWRD